MLTLYSLQTRLFTNFLEIIEFFDIMQGIERSCFNT